MRMLLGFLPVVALIAAWLAVAQRSRDWREGLLVAFALVSAVALLSTEGLSLVGAVGTGAVIGLYVVMAAVVGWAIARGPGPRWPALRPWLRHPLVIVMILQAAVLTLLATASAPNNSDSMAYHLSKVEHWVSSGTLAPYPTSISSQIYLSPLAEIGVTHLRLLTGTDRLSSFVQLLAHVISAVGITVIARNLGLRRDFQLVAALVATSAPMAVSQAVTTQNDYLTTAYLVCAVAFTTAPDLRRRAWTSAALVSLALGLAIATKATAVLFGLPVAVWFVATRLPRSPRRLAPLLALGVVLVLALNAGQLARNVSVFGDPTGPSEVALRSQQVTLSTTLGNVVRNISLNLGVPSAGANAAIGHGVRSALSAVGVDPDDPAALAAAPGFDVDDSRNEDRASSPGQWLLALAAAAAAAFSRRLRRQTGALVVVLAAGFVAFSVVLRWQPYGGRLLLPVLILTAVPVAAMLSRLPIRLVGIGLAALTIASLPWLLQSQYRPLLGPGSILRTGPEVEYFAARPQLHDPYVAATDYMRTLGVSTIGLRSGFDDFEYPVWWLMSRGGSSVRVVGVDVENRTRSFGQEPRPDVVLCTSRCETLPRQGVTVRQFGPLSVAVATKPGGSAG